MANPLFEKKNKTIKEPPRLKNAHEVRGNERERLTEKVALLVYKGSNFDDACEKAGYDSDTCQWMLNSEVYNQTLETRKIDALRRDAGKFDYSSDTYCRELYTMSKEFESESSRLKAMELLGKALKFFEPDNNTNVNINIANGDFIKEIEERAKKRLEANTALTIESKELPNG